MSSNLVIVESPAKAKTIEGYLGKDFTVKSSFGHVRDLPVKGLGIDIEKGFNPNYEVLPDKKKVITELKALAKNASTVWLATDEDREGEAISWHLAEVLDLDEKSTNRIVFHEITKNAILQAIEKPRKIDINLVNAQQARRVLDRIVGFEVSPVLWRKVKPSLSAGRVQSVAVRLIVEKEEEIKNFKATMFYKVSAVFNINNEFGKAELKSELDHKFKTKEEAHEFLEACKGAEFKIKDIETKPAKRSPAPPFTTSTLQQEASRKLSFSVSRTMMVAQQLYESGKITYMRTDSVNLSKLALAAAKEEIVKQFGDKYHKSRQFSTKSKGAQEAHEAIRPTQLNVSEIDGDAAQKRLYSLIWKRAIASQMADAQLEQTNISISISGKSHLFIAKGEVVKFDGFLKVYMESKDDEDETSSGILPKVSVGEKMDYKTIEAVQKYTNPPYRYTEASLVKKLEELGIGRPSTYAPTISTIQKREYVVKENRDGNSRQIAILSLKDNKISETAKEEKFGYEKAKLFPTDTGDLVTKFLMQYFKDIMDYNFTASVEVEFDEIAQGKRKWNEMIHDFYEPFHENVVKTTETGQRVKGERLLGKDPKTGLNIYVKLGRYGVMVQMGETDSENKPKFASLQKGQTLDNINLEQALKLFAFPRILGEINNSEVKVGIGKYGPYVLYDNKFYSLKPEDDPNTIDLEGAKKLIESKIEEQKSSIIKTFPEREDIIVKNGRYGPYIAVGKSNIRIPKSYTPSELTLDECLALIEKGQKKTAKSVATKEPATKKTVKKKTATKVETKKVSKTTKKS